MTQEEWIQKLQEEGYTDVAVRVEDPNTDFGEHLHKQTSVILL